MKPWALDHLLCPACRGRLSLISYEVDQAETMSGVLRCDQPACRSWYPIVRGVPRLLPAALRLGLTREFANRFHAELLADHIPLSPQTEPADDLRVLKLHTIQNFGFEWVEYARFGWDDPVFNLQHEEQVFQLKSLLKPHQIAGRLVLDAGCGNGRYTYWAAQYGGKVIGVDLGDGVDSAFENTRSSPNVQIVQGDLFHLPFVEPTFDVIFSIGVLMHTGDAHRATNCLLQTLKPGGSLTVHLYGLGNPIYEWTDAAVRRKTTALSVPELQQFTRRAWALTRFLERIRLLWIASLFVRLDPHPHCIFDWYSAPIATHHSYPEVKAWFQQVDVAVVQSNESRPRNWSGRLYQRLAPLSVTVRAEKPL